jgi:hypothetical protein
MEPDRSSTLTVGLTATRRALSEWLAHPVPVVRRWLRGSLLAAGLLLVGTLVVAEVATPDRDIFLGVPPVTTGNFSYMTSIVGHNLLVLALHTMACVAGFIAGSSVPHEAERLTGVNRVVHQYGARLALIFVALATSFSMGYQAYALGTSASSVAFQLHTGPALLLLALLPHALPELLALFLPLSAWVIASRTDGWDELLAAALVTTLLAIPILVAAATWETYGAPHLISWVVDSH